MRILILIPILLLLVSCQKTLYVTAPLECPDPLALEKADADLKADINQLKQDNPDLYEFFLYRSKLQQARRETLQNICRSTHSES